MVNSLFKSMEDKRFKKLISSELRSLNSGMVSQKKSLKELMKEEKPHVKKRGEGKHYFDKSNLKEIENSIPIHKRGELKLPIMIYNDPTLDQCYVKKELEGKVIKELVGMDNKTLNGDKIWFSKPLITDLTRKYEDIFQLIWTPQLDEKENVKNNKIQQNKNNNF